MDFVINNSSSDESDVSRIRLRRLKKPLIEKKRRERINKSLTCLKTMLLDNIRRNGGTQTAKLDKADILEMTVKYLRSLQYGHSTLLHSCKTQYSNGYQDCANEALWYLGQTRCHSNEVTTRLSNHLLQTQPPQDVCNSAMDTKSSENRTPLTIAIPNTHARVSSLDTHLLRTVEDMQDTSTSGYSSQSALTSGYSSQSESPRSTAAMFMNSDNQYPEIDSCSCLSDVERSRSSSPMDVWRPW